MDGSKTVKKLREGYLNLLVYTLKDNIKKTLQNVNVDESVILHYGLTIEEDCFNKNQSDVAPYTKAITAARLSIEKYTAKQQPYPMISNALHLDEIERVSKQTSSNDHANEAERPKNDQIQRIPNSALAAADDVIVIDSSDSEDALDAMITDDMKLQQCNDNDNNNTMGEILVTVRTESSKIDEPSDTINN